MINVPAERSATPPQTSHPSLCHQNSWVRGKDLISLLTLSQHKYVLGVKATCSRHKPGREMCREQRVRGNLAVTHLLRGFGVMCECVEENPHLW